MSSASPTAGTPGPDRGDPYEAPDTVVMHRRRWAWLASYTDSTGRPLAAPTAGSFNSLAEAGAPQAQGRVGSVLGMDVLVDPSIPALATRASSRTGTRRAWVSSPAPDRLLPASSSASR